MQGEALEIGIRRHLWGIALPGSLYASRQFRNRQGGPCWLAHKGEWSNAGERHTRHVPEVIPGKKADLFRG